MVEPPTGDTRSDEPIGPAEGGGEPRTVSRRSVFGLMGGAAAAGAGLAVAGSMAGPLSPAGAITGTSFFPLTTPYRAYDSRKSGGGNGQTNPAGPISASNSPRGIIASTGGSSQVPDTAAGYWFNLTSTASTFTGFLAVFNANEAFPGTSNLNYSGPDIANTAFCGTTSDLKIGAQAGGPGSTQFILDVFGYFQ